MSGVIRWEEPPPRRGGRKAKVPARSAQWEAVSAALREAPQRWAVVAESDDFRLVGGYPCMIRDGRLAAFRPVGAFEAAYRSVGTSHRVYARYVGEAS